MKSSNIMRTASINGCVWVGYLDCVIIWVDDDLIVWVLEEGLESWEEESVSEVIVISFLTEGVKVFLRNLEIEFDSIGEC